MGRYQQQSLVLRGTMKRSVTEHRAIVRAIREADTEPGDGGLPADAQSTSRWRGCVWQALAGSLEGDAFALLVSEAEPAELE
jgi:hypothetical protein